MILFAWNYFLPRDLHMYEHNTVMWEDYNRWEVNTVLHGTTFMQLLAIQFLQINYINIFASIAHPVHLQVTESDINSLESYLEWCRS